MVVVPEGVVVILPQFPVRQEPEPVVIRLEVLAERWQARKLAVVAEPTPYGAWVALVVLEGARVILLHPHLMEQEGVAEEGTRRRP
jgi:predicted nicotinamide N-methyase